MKILIAGIKGFIGSALAQKCQAAGHEVWGFQRGDSIKWGSICHADVVINCAGETKDESKMIEDNCVFAVQLAEGCKAFGKRLIHLGSLLEFSLQTMYSTTKSAASLVVDGMISDGQDFFIVRPSTVFGPDDNSMLAKLWDAFENNTEFEMYDESRDWIHIDDLCDAILQIIPLKNPKYRRYEVGSSYYLRNTEVLAIYSKYLNRKINVTFQGNRMTMGTIASPYEMEEIGWRPKIAIEDGIKEYLHYKSCKGKDWLGAEL